MTPLNFFKKCEHPQLLDVLMYDVKKWGKVKTIYR